MVKVNEVTFGNVLGRPKSTARTAALCGQSLRKSEREVTLGPAKNSTRGTVMSTLVDGFDPSHTISVRLGSKGREASGNCARAVMTLN